VWENSGGPNWHHNKAAPTANNKLRKHMPANTEHRTSHTKTGSARTYPSELQPLRQSLVVALARLDFELQSDIETIRNSSVDQWMKQQRSNAARASSTAPHFLHSATCKLAEAGSGTCGLIFFEAMPRYFFHIHHKDGIDQDDAGTDLATFMMHAVRL
jgi:hypothetical protein